METIMNVQTRAQAPYPKSTQLDVKNIITPIFNFFHKCYSSLEQCHSSNCHEKKNYVWMIDKSFSFIDKGHSSNYHKKKKNYVSNVPQQNCHAKKKN